MLKRMTGLTAEEREGIRISEASFESLFPQKLEYNAPAHGTWNIVHIAMAVPGSHSIYVCSDNCLRGVVMTAAEMGCSDRFSSVTLRERNIQVDNLETVTIEGVSDVLAHLEIQPEVVFVFLVCLHIFTGSDEEYIFRELGRRFPKIRFVKGYMDCIRQKEGPTPDMKLRMAEYGIIEPLKIRKRRVNILGGDVPFSTDSQLVKLLADRKMEVRQQSDCKTFRDFLALGDAFVNVCTYPNAHDAIKALSERTGSRFAYLSAAVSYEEIRDQIQTLFDACSLKDVPVEWFLDEERSCTRALERLAGVLEGCSVAIDYTAHSRPLGIARLLIQNQIQVECVFLDSVLEEERDAFEWLKENCPDLCLIPTVQPRMALYGRGRGIPSPERKIIALGQKAAWFCQSGYFVNIIEGGGTWGFQGIRELCTLLEEASKSERDYRQIIPRKGIGWPSCCTVPVSAP